jgi:hypothetical protein
MKDLILNKMLGGDDAGMEMLRVAMDAAKRAGLTQQMKDQKEAVNPNQEQLRKAAMTEERQGFKLTTELSNQSGLLRGHDVAFHLRAHGHASLGAGSAECAIPFADSSRLASPAIRRCPKSTQDAGRNGENGLEDGRANVCTKEVIWRQ